MVRQLSEEIVLNRKENGSAAYEAGTAIFFLHAWFFYCLMMWILIVVVYFFVGKQAEYIALEFFSAGFALDVIPDHDAAEVFMNVNICIAHVEEPFGRLVQAKAIVFRGCVCTCFNYHGFTMICHAPLIQIWIGTANLDCSRFIEVRKLLRGVAPVDFPFVLMRYSDAHDVPPLCLENFGDSLPIVNAGQWPVYM